MTQTLTEALDSLGCQWSLVDRRFSTSVAEIGKFSVRKLISAAFMPFRVVANKLRFRPEVIIFFATTSTYSFLVDWLLSEVLRLLRTPTVLYLHTFGFRGIAERGRVWEWLVGRILGSGATVATLGPALALDVSQWVEDSRVAYIPNTAAEPILDASDGTSERMRPVILYLSNLIPEKGADFFVDAAVELHKNFPQLLFVLAGAPVDGEFTRALLSKIDKSGLQACFQFLGAVTEPEQKWRLIKDADILAFTSTLREAQPLTILEALSVGTPVVAFDVGGVRDILRDGLDGHLVPVGDRDAFETAVAELLMHNGLEKGLAIERAYCQRFSREKFISNWAQVLNCPDPKPRAI